jgi:hypothetical protein
MHITRSGLRRTSGIGDFLIVGVRVDELQAREQFRNDVIGHGHRATDPEFIGQRLLPIHVQLALLIGQQKLLRVWQESLAFLRYLDLFAQTVEQPAIELPLERLNAGRNRRLG